MELCETHRMSVVTVSLLFINSRELEVYVLLSPGHKEADFGRRHAGGNNLKIGLSCGGTASIPGGSECCLTRS